MTTSIPHANIRLRDLSELVAGIPYIIGFPPTDSLVLYTFRRCPQIRLSSTIRVNLPRPDHVLLVAEEMAEAVAMNEAASVIAVVVAENGSEHRELVEMLRKTLEDKDILLTHSSWVPKIAHGQQWRCYDDPLCTDTVPDPQSSALAAATAVAGDTTYPDREAMAAHLAPDPEEMVAYRRKLLAAYRSSSTPSYTDQDLHADLKLLGHALDAATNSYELPTLTDHQMVRLGRALSQGPVKDECLAMALSDEPEAAERLWTVLIRGLPAPERAEPAFLLAMSAYLRGAGVIAALALKIVMEANPLHRLAVLLDYALQRGMPPDHLRGMLVTSVLKNNEDHDDEPATDDDDPPWDTTPEPSTSTPPAEPEPSSATPELSPATSEPSTTVPEPLAATSSATPESSMTTSPEEPSTVEETTSPSVQERNDAEAHTGQSPGPHALPTNGPDPAVVMAEHVDRESIESKGGVTMARTGAAPEPPADPSFREEPPMDHERGGLSSARGGLVPADPEPRRGEPSPSSPRANADDGALVRRTVTMDPLTAFLPPSTELRGLW